MGQAKQVQRLAEECFSWNPPRDSRVAAIANFTWGFDFASDLYAELASPCVLVEIPH
jgi:hypothetical protein